MATKQNVACLRTVTLELAIVFLSIWEKTSGHIACRVLSCIPQITRFKILSSDYSSICFETWMWMSMRHIKVSISPSLILMESRQSKQRTSIFLQLELSPLPSQLAIPLIKARRAVCFYGSSATLTINDPYWSVIVARTCSISSCYYSLTQMRLLVSTTTTASICFVQNSVDTWLLLTMTQISFVMNSLSQIGVSYPVVLVSS